MKFQSPSLTATKKLAQQLASQLAGGEVIALSGPLGAGKTTLTQAVARCLGVKTRVLSPSFVLLRSYPLARLPSKTLHHLDLYRLQSARELKTINLEDLISPQAIVIIEWADKISHQLPPQTIRIKIDIIDTHSRQFIIS